MTGKKFITLTLAALLLLGLAFGWFWWQTHRQADPLDAIPPDTPLVISFEKAPGQLKLWQADSLWPDLKEFALAGQTAAQLSLLESLFSLNPEDSAWFASARFLAAVHKVNATGFSAVYIFDRSGTGRVDENQWAAALKVPVQTRQYRGLEIHSFKTGPESVLSVVRYRNLLVAGFNDFLLESVVSHLRDGKPGHVR